MSPVSRTPFFKQAFSCWNWKCALFSATARSIVYLSAMAGADSHGRLSVVGVEMIYVTLTAGLYAGMQQRALDFSSRLLGNATVALGVPGLAQALDWLSHRAAGAAAPGKATLAACVFAVVSALFHLHVMRSGAFLTGRRGRSLVDDFRRMPRLAAGFAAAPFVHLAALVTALVARPAPAIETEAAQ